MPRDDIEELKQKVIAGNRSGVMQLLKEGANPEEFLPKRPDGEAELCITEPGKAAYINLAPVRTILHQMVNLGWEDEAYFHYYALKLLGCRLEIIDSYSETPMTIALLKGLFDFADKLKSLGASITPKGRDKCNIFHTLSMIDQENAINFVSERISVKKRTEMVNGRNMYGSTPLMVAAQKGALNSIKLLLSYGADVQAENEDNMTAFMFAVENGHIEIAKLLKEAGSNINHKATKHHGIDSFSIAMLSKNLEMLDALIDMKADWNTVISIPCISKSLHASSVQVRAGVIVQALVGGEYEFAQRLIEKASVLDGTLKSYLVEVFKGFATQTINRNGYDVLKFLESIGIIEASYELYKLHKSGDFKLSSDKEAQEFLEKAASQGYKKAKAELAELLIRQEEAAEKKKTELLAKYLDKKEYSKALPLLEEGSTEHTWVKAIVEVGGIIQTLSLKDILGQNKILQLSVGKILNLAEIKKLERIVSIAKQIIDKGIDLFSEEEKELVKKVTTILEIIPSFEKANKTLEAIYNKVSNPSFKDTKGQIPREVDSLKAKLLELAKLLADNTYTELNDLKVILISNIQKHNSKVKAAQKIILEEGLAVFNPEVAAPAPTKKAEPKVEPKAKVAVKEYSFSIETLREYADFKKGSKERKAIEKSTNISTAPISSLEKALEDYIEKHAGETTPLQTAIRLAFHKKVSAYFIVELLSKGEKELRDAAEEISLNDASDVRSSYGSLAGTSMFGSGPVIEGAIAKLATKALEDTESSCSEDKMRENLEDTVNITPSTLATLDLFYHKKYQNITINDLENMLFDLGAKRYSWHDKGEKYVITMPDRPPIGGHKKHASDAKSGKGQGAVIAMESLTALRDSLEVSNIFDDYLNQDQKAAEAAILKAQAEADAADEAAARLCASALEVEKSKWIVIEIERFQSIDLLERIRDDVAEPGDLEKLPKAYSVLGIHMPDALLLDIDKKQVRTTILKEALTQILKEIHGNDSNISEAATSSSGNISPHAVEIIEIETQRTEAIALFKRIRDEIAQGTNITEMYKEIEKLPIAYLALGLDISDSLLIDIGNKTVIPDRLLGELTGRLGIINGTHHGVPIGMHSEHDDF